MTLDFMLPSLVARAALLAPLLLSMVLAQPAGGTADATLASRADDAEEFLGDSPADRERWPVGYSYTRSSDLELGTDPDHGPQMLGLRFNGLTLPEGARIDEAVVEFTADRAGSGDLVLEVYLEAAGQPAPFVQDEDGAPTADLSSRPGGMVIEWRPGEWQAGLSYRTPNLAPALQELIDRQGWRPGDPVVVLLRPAGGEEGSVRSAYSFDSDPQLAPRLLVAHDGQGVVPPAEPAGGDLDAAPPTAGPDEAAEGAAAGDAATEETAEAGEAAEEPAQADPQQATEPAQADPQVDEEATTSERPDVEDQPAGRSPNGGDDAIDPAVMAAPAETVEPQRVRFTLRPTHQAGVRGSVLLSDYGLAGTIVAVQLQNTRASSSYRVSLHEGSCDSLGNTVAMLEPIDGVLGMSTSLVEFSLEELSARDYHVNVFLLGEVTRLSGCAELGTN